MNKLFILLLVLGVTISPVFAQTQPTQQPTPTSEELEQQKAERKKNAFRLLDQIIDEAQSLRLPENRVRVQTTAADVLWDSNPGRARSLFSMAAESVAEMGRQQQNTNNRRGGPQTVERRAFQLRQELVLAAARHDAQLAYQLLAITKPAALPAPQTADSRNPRPQFNSEDNLEQQLLGRIAALDPKLAAQNADQMMEKGQFPRSLSEVINNLYKQDPDAASKMGDRTVKKLQATNLLTNVEAASLAQMLLMRGPRPNGTPNVANPTLIPVLEQGPYAELLGSVVEIALKATPPSPQNNQRGQIQRGRPVAATVAGPGYVPPPGATEAQLEQQGALRLLAGLQIALPLIDQYVPAKSAAVRQKLTESGMGANSPFNMAQSLSAMQGNPTSDTLIQAAANAPQQAQTRLYQQAAIKALEEGNVDRARQIATNHLQANARDSVMQRIDFRELSLKGENARLDEIRQTIARLQSDGEKLNMILQLARETQKANPKLSNQLLDEARQMTSHRATNYEQFDWQLKVARAFASVDPARSFEVLDPGISQLNELLAAAAVLNGFEISMFREGEMSLQGGSGLTSMVQRFGQELGALADKDVERAETLAGRFQYTEARIMARLAIVQGLLGLSRPATSGQVNVFRN